MRNEENGYDSYIDDDTRYERAEFDNLFGLINISYGSYNLYQAAQTLPHGYLDIGSACAPSSWGDYAASNLATAFASYVGYYVADEYFLSTDSEAEYYGTQIGSTIGSAIGYSFGGPVGAGVGSFLGAVAGDSLGENWHEVDGIFEDGLALEDIESTFRFLGNSAADFVSTLLGGDEPPPPPTAEVTYEFNAVTGEYELSNSYERDGGKVSHVKGAGDQITSTIDTLLAQYTAGDAQLANRHEMPEIKIGYQGDSQYVLVNGVRLGSLNGETMQAAMGEVLGSAVIEGGDPLTNHILYNDELSGGERFAMLTDSLIQTTVRHHYRVGAEGTLLAA